MNRCRLLEFVGGPPAVQTAFCARNDPSCPAFTPQAGGCSIGLMVGCVDHNDLVIAPVFKTIKAELI